MPGIFISYRRADTGDLCDRLATRLRWAFGEDAIFRDVNTILAGSSFPDALRQGVEACPVMLALIGPSWLAPVGNPPRRRIDEPDDWVRAEIVSALCLGHLVIPVLAPGAPNLAYANLPPDLAPLTKFTPIFLRPDPYFDADVQTLTRAVRPYANQGPASWFLLVGGVFLALMWSSQLPFIISTLPDWLSTLIWGLTWQVQIAIGAYLCWQAQVRRQWGWFAFGVVMLLIGLAQVVVNFGTIGAFNTPTGYYWLDTFVSFTWPMVAGLCLIAGWTGPRQRRAPDTITVRWSGWHIALACALGDMCAILVINWFALYDFNPSTKVAVVYVWFFSYLLLAVASATTAAIVCIQAFTVHHSWWGISALALGLIASAACCLSDFPPTWAYVSDVTIFAVSGLLSILFALYSFFWLVSYTSRARVIQPL